MNGSGKLLDDCCPEWHGQQFSQRNVDPAGHSLKRVNLPSLARCGDYAELLHQAHVVHLAPMFRTLAPSNAEDVDHSKGYTVASWRNAHKLARMGASPSLADDHHVAFGDHTLDRGLEVWEGAA